MKTFIATIATIALPAVMAQDDNNGTTLGLWAMNCEQQDALPCGDWSGYDLECMNNQCQCPENSECNDAFNADDKNTFGDHGIQWGQCNDDSRPCVGHGQNPGGDADRPAPTLTCVRQNDYYSQCL